MLQNFTLFNQSLNEIKQTRALINTLNAHSFNTVSTDENFRNAIMGSDVLLPDGISVVLAMRLLTGKRLKKIAGVDLFHYEMNRINIMGGKCFFLGSSENTLQLIHRKATKEYPEIILASYSPPYKPEFTEDDSKLMIDAVNDFEPDVLFVGMTAPKQEKWAYQHFSKLNVGHVCCIGAVFDFYAGTVKRSPQWMITIGLEWLYRLIKEPKRMWKRYLIGNIKFIFLIIQEKIMLKKSEQ
ncbi:MAG: WecB/TagA/CpsF family glycosyltransferase [Paludibacter sp.]